MAAAAILTFGHISVVDEDICIKFGTLIDIDHIWATITQNPSLQKFKMAAAGIFDLDFGKMGLLT